MIKSWNGEMLSLKDELQKGGWSCVVGNGAEMRTFSRRGVADLYEILHTEPQLLHGAYIADKVVGKGAAALMILGKISRLYTHIISTPALSLLRKAGVIIDFDIETEYIINRNGTGRCPVETLCDGISEPEEMLPLISDFLAKMPSGL